MVQRLRPQFTDQLVALETLALGGVDMVLEQLDRVLIALEQQDVWYAQIAIADDDRLEVRYVDVHRAILLLHALQAPVASDLRLVHAISHLIDRTRQMGDECVKVAKLIPLSGHAPRVQPEILADVVDLGRRARGNVEHCRNGFVDRFTTIGPNGPAPQSAMERTSRAIVRLAVAVGDDADTREWATNMVRVVDALERVSDGAAAVSRHTAFLLNRQIRGLADSSHPIA